MCRRYTDAHCHLQDAAFAEDRSAQIRKAVAAGVHRLVVNGTHPSDWRSVTALAKQWPEIRPQFGVHPWKAAELPADWLTQLEAWLTAHPDAGVGEIGLDAQLTEVPLPRQMEVLDAQLNMARQYQRPCTLHVLRAWPETDRMLKQYPGLRLLFHSYSGSARQVEGLLSHDSYFSFGGVLLRQPLSWKVQAALQAVPMDRLLIETDAPFQHPAGRKHRQEPAGLLSVAESAARLLGLSSDQLWPILETNARRLFGE